MKYSILCNWILFLLSLLEFSCKRELSCESCSENNKPPIAIAGPDQTVTLPLDSVKLDGSSSSDPDNNIISYQWNKISGPSPFVFSNQNSNTTSVSTLTVGRYEFELTVKDAGGLVAKDTTMVTVSNPASTNMNPVSKPGNDSLIYSAQSVCTSTQLTIKLDGRNSYDPDGNIIAYHWSGPGNILNPDAAVTTVSGSFIGTIGFSLKVTDNSGATDTKFVNLTIIPGNRPTIQVTATLLGNLSTPRAEVATVSAGGKIFFAGGHSFTGPEGFGSSRVDIYNIATNSWSTAELSVPRHGITAVAAGNKVFFAGGHQSFYGDVDIGEYATVDIYDLTTNTWSVASLSEPRGYIASATVGNKVLFAGGWWIEGPWAFHHSNVVDIYDLSTNTWSVAFLSDKRAYMSAVAADNKIYIAGGNNESGPLSSIDVYDAISNTWSISSMNEQRMIFGGIAVNNKVYWAGGSNLNSQICTVEINDAITQSASIQQLTFPKEVYYSLLKDNKILFLNQWSPFDLLDLNTNTWYTGTMPVQRPDAGMISVNNKIYMAGGFVPGANTVTNQVWTLDF